MAWATTGTSIKGSTGAAGPTGTRGSLWYSGHGAPGALAPTPQAQDHYLDLDTGTVYLFS